jgi:hypothetical protein
MWADNETDVDLLGFDFLVDALVVALTEPRLLPLTLGVLGDWGSGKSSVLKIVKQELESIGGGSESGARYVCVGFSPWQYEDYDDVKVALMTAVLDRLQAEVGEDEEDQQERVSKLRVFARGLRRRTRWLGRSALTAAPTAGQLAALAADPSMDPALLDLVKVGATAVANEGQRLFKEPTDAQAGSPVDSSSDPIVDVGAFRAQFAELVNSLDHVDAVVVLIDDLDRCLPETVVDTFEVIRLFLNTPKTAFAVAANQQVVESAIDSRYPQLRRPDGTGVGADYLEKMLQLKVAIPALSAPEAETYMNLLLAELRLDDVQFARIREYVRGRRAASGLTVAFNLGVAGHVLGDAVPVELVRDLEWAANVAPALSGGLRGNPRQLKRFLNNVILKARAAERREVALDLKVLAKLMVLEDQHVADFQRLYDWQINAAGPIAELAAAEAYVRSGSTNGTSPPGMADGAVAANVGTRPPRGKRPAGLTPDRERADAMVADQPVGDPVTAQVQAWADKPHVRAWLTLEPALGTTDLGPYFTYSRDKLSLGVVVSRLAPPLQELLARIQSDREAVRRSALDKVAALVEDERGQLVEALLGGLLRHPAGPAFTAALELVDRVPETVAVVCEAMTRIPTAAVPAARVTTAVRRLPAGKQMVEDLLDRWERSGIPALETVTRAAREGRARSGR